jgi:hypothetical protein
LNFQDVTRVERAVVPWLVILQKHLKDRVVAVRMCCLSYQLRILLVDSGAVKLEVIKKDLGEALQSLVKA